MKAFKILSPTAILGYGYPLESFYNGMEMEPDLIAVDAGSVDPGPYYLGSGKPFTDRTGVKRDLRYMLREGVKHGIPVVVGTAGGSGAKPHLDWCREIVEELAVEEKLNFRLGLIPADLDNEVVVKAWKDGLVKPLNNVPEVDEEKIRACSHIVGQMGIEPICQALELGCNVILAGRAYDPTVFAALPIMLGYNPGLALHAGKILECAAIAATPGSGSDSAMGILYEDRFELVPLNSERKFTAQSTAAHTLYEKSDPTHLPGPGGSIDLTDVEFIEKADGIVEVRGSRFVPEDSNTIKLEGTRCVGKKSISIAGVRDPIMIAQIDEIVELVKERVEMLLENENIKGRVHIHIYGKNAVMDSREPLKDCTPHEIGILIEAIAPTQDEAATICSLTRSTMLHYGYDGRIATAGNLAFPFSPSDVAAGDVYEFTLYHLISGPVLDNLFPVEIIEV